MRITRIPLYLGAISMTLFGYGVIKQAKANERHEQAQAQQSVDKSSEAHNPTETLKQIEGLKWLKHTESKYICMVNNKRFDKVQIPTVVDGKTYYGCCSMCKAKLEKIQAMRQATDPISGNIVDKATAIIGTAPDGTAYYFEDEENMKQFDKIKSNNK